jgi:hypothetical protein
MLDLLSGKGQARPPFVGRKTIIATLTFYIAT